MLKLSILIKNPDRYAARLDELKLHVGVVLVLLTDMKTRYEDNEDMEGIMLDHMFELLGDMEGELESLRDELGLEGLPF